MGGVVFVRGVAVLSVGFAIAMLGAASGGCALILRADSPGEHCGFQNNGTSCGQCLATNCASKIDACCSDDACLKNGPGDTSFMSFVDECAGGNLSGCLALSVPSSSSGSRGRLAACVAEQCSERCPGVLKGDGGTVTASDGSTFSNCVKTISGGCSCPSDGPSGPECSAASVRRQSAICVKGSNACRCDALLCGQTHGDNCACSTDPANDLSVPGSTNYDCSRASAGGRCCVYEVRSSGTVACVCGPDQPSCSAGQLSVSECSAEAISAALGSRAPDRCSSN